MELVVPRLDPEGRVFVGIASYRDPDCQWTVKDLFEKAAKPERIQVGICWQVIPGQDEDCVQVATRPGQVRGVTFHATRESRGACWARHQMQKLWQGEDYYFQIDSHCRFEKDWDSRYIAMLRACGSPRPVLTTYPPGFDPPDKFSRPRIAIMTAGAFHDTGVLIPSSWSLFLDQAPPAPLPTALLSAGQVFAPGRIVEEVPYDPHLYFQGEEISMAARLWTHGWDLFVPNDSLMYHDYSAGRTNKRHWSDNKGWHDINVKAARRVMRLLGTRACEDAEVLEDIERYGLGKVRNLAEYERFSGIDFKTGTIAPRAAEGRFPRHPSLDGPARRRRETFEAIWRDNRLGIKETRNGPGSTMAATGGLRKRLAALFVDLGIETLCDAGCGDLHWLAPLTEGLRLYMGHDLVEAAIDQNLLLYRHRPNHLFQVADLVTAILPRADAILCREVLTHLGNDDIMAALRNFRNSGSRYLIATTHQKSHNAHSVSAIGEWRALNLETEPFGLLPPLIRIPDGAGRTGKCLGVWPLAHVTV